MQLFKDSYRAIGAHHGTEGTAGAILLRAPFNRMFTHVIQAGGDLEEPLRTYLDAEAAPLAHLDVYLNLRHNKNVNISIGLPS